MATSNEPVLCLLDLETGSLDPAVCAIGSAALVWLDADLAEVDHHAWLVADVLRRLRERGLWSCPVAQTTPLPSITAAGGVSRGDLGSLPGPA